MRIRKAKKQDLGRVLDLWWGLYDGQRNYHPAFYRIGSRRKCLAKARKNFLALLAGRKGFLLVVEESDRILGFLEAAVVLQTPVWENTMGHTSRTCLLAGCIGNADSRAAGFFISK